jgi:hypothetical protein
MTALPISPSNFTYQSHGFDAFFSVRPDQSANETLEVTSSRGHLCAAHLFKGAFIGPKSPFQQDPNGLFMRFQAAGPTGGGTAFCSWLGLTRAYLGLKFVVNGQTHYGWARISSERLE